jgi:hypothetical protein
MITLLAIESLVAGGGLVAVLIHVLVIVLIIGLIVWLVQAIPIPEPFGKVIYYLAIIIGVILIILQLLALL